LEVAREVSREEFKRKRSFISWLRPWIKSQKSGRVSHQVLFLGYDPVTWTLWGSIAAENLKPSWASRVHSMPTTIREAEGLWDSVQDDFFCVFFKRDMYLHEIFVAVRQGIWNSLDEAALPQKSEYVELDDEEFDRQVSDKKIRSAMCRETHLFGVSCRIIRKRNGEEQG
jgi:hypothetical protein